MTIHSTNFANDTLEAYNLSAGKVHFILEAPRGNTDNVKRENGRLGIVVTKDDLIQELKAAGITAEDFKTNWREFVKDLKPGTSVDLTFNNDAARRYVKIGDRLVHPETGIFLGNYDNVRNIEIV